MLPPRGTADDLLGSYWEFSHPVFPILHRPTFIEQYQKLWVPGISATRAEDDAAGSTKTIFHIQLSLVFAVASQFTTLVDPSARTSYGNEFYQRSRKLVNFEILDGVQLATVQCLLLHAVYLYYEQPTEYTDRCWNVVGFAIRAAQGLGLHLNGATSRLVQREREMRRRIWHCAIMLDRSVPGVFSSLPNSFLRSYAVAIILGFSR